MNGIHHTWRKAAELYLAGLTSWQAIEQANVLEVKPCRAWLYATHGTRRDTIRRQSNPQSRNREQRRACQILTIKKPVEPTGPLTQQDRVAVRLEVIRGLLASMGTPWSKSYENKSPDELETVIANLRKRISDLHGGR